MKKLILSATLAAAFLTGLSAMGQGYFVFSGATRGVWDAWSQATPRLAQTNNVAFLFGSGTPSVASIMTSVPTNNAVGYSYSTAWNDILNDPNFTLAFNTNGNALATALCAANGSWQYNGGATFPVAGTSVNGGTTTIFVIGWNANYATPSAAQTAGAAVGWSGTFSYTYGANPTGTPGTFSAAGLQPFGVGAVPEPSTFALAGLGAAALMIFRRKK